MNAGVAGADLGGPKGLVRFLCPADLDQNPDAEPRPRVVVLVTNSEESIVAPGRLLWCYRSRNNDRAVAILDQTTEDAVRAAMPSAADVWTAMVRSRHITSR
jgi:hypothetical protein